MGTSVAKPKNWTWVSLLGLSAAVVYVGMTLAAVKLYPGSTSPMDIYLSELGNADQSPDGWLVFDLGMIIAGVLALPFFWGLAKYYSRRAGKRLTRTVLILGLLNAVSVAVAGGVAEHVNMIAHIVCSLLIFASTIPLFVIYGVILRRSSGFSRAVSWYGFVASLVALALLVALAVVGVPEADAGSLWVDGPEAGLGSLLEWVVVLLYVVWVSLMSLDVSRRPMAAVAE